MLDAILLVIAALGVSTSILFNLIFASKTAMHIPTHPVPRTTVMPDSFNEQRLDQLLQQLEQFSLHTDASAPPRELKMLNITRDTGEFLRAMVLSSRAGRILEIGTSNGYSTLWLARAARLTGASVSTIEASQYKVALAAENFRLAGLNAQIRQLQGDAGQILGQLVGSYDLVFLDAERSYYCAWWPAIRKLLPLYGCLIIDNAVSHAHELAEFFQLLNADQDFVQSLLPVGNGELMLVRTAVSGV